MRRPRFTVRTMMAVVAIVGVSLGGYLVGVEWWRNWLCHSDRANYYGNLSISLIRAADENREVEGCLPNPPNTPPPLPARIAEMRAMAKAYAVKEERFRNLARHPWISVEPDPPESE